MCPSKVLMLLITPVCFLLMMHFNIHIKNYMILILAATLNFHKILYTKIKKTHKKILGY